MRELSFDTGLVSFNVNNRCELAFNPTDSAFVERLFGTFETLDKKQEEYRSRLGAAKDYRETFEFMRGIDGEMRETLNAVFGSDVCAPLFGSMNVFAEGDGLPVWANFLFCVMDVVNEALEGMGQKADDRIAKYAAKYRRKKR